MSVEEGFLALAGHYGRVGRFVAGNGQVFAAQPSCGSLGHAGLGQPLLPLMHFLLSANTQLFVNEWPVARDKLTD